MRKKMWTCTLFRTDIGKDYTCTYNHETSATGITQLLLTTKTTLFNQC